MDNFNFYKDWIYINLFNLVSINWNRFKCMKEIKGVFVNLKCKYKFTINYAPFMFCVHSGKLLSVEIHDVSWKDKYDTPRHEENPFVSIGLFNYFFFNWIWDLPSCLNTDFMDNDNYWEQALWYLYYCDKDIKKAKETWPWYYNGKENSWDDKFLIK